MFPHFQPSQHADSPPSEPGLKIPFLQRPLDLVTVSDRAMEPELRPGQQVFVQNFDATAGANYLEQRMAWRLSGRTVIRRAQMRPGGTLRLFGIQPGYEVQLTPPDGWTRPADWKTTGVLHPDCTCLGPLLTARDGQCRTFIATHQWSN